MSTNSECRFVETEPGKWYYILEDYNAPKNAWDWREFASAYGPFSSEEAADRHLQDHHANPGGSSTTTHEHFRMDDVMKKLIAGAPDNMRAFSRGFGFR